MPVDSQLALVNGSALTKRDVFDAVDSVIVQLNQTGDLDKAVGVIDILNDIDTVTGKAKAKLLWGMEIWFRQNRPTEDFADHILSTTKIQNRKTVLEYVNMWQQVEDEYIPKKIQERPMRDLVPIANMLAQGYEPSKKQWDEINLSTSSSELGDIIRKVKGKKARKSGMTIEMARDGSLYVWKNNKRSYVGFLDIKETDNDANVAKAIERIIIGAQIIRK